MPVGTWAGRDRPAAAEFFAGIGLVRMAIESEGFRVAFANDIERDKRAIYAANFDASTFRLGDVREVHGDNVPDVELATASFPCTDLSLAGNRAGLSGGQSGMFWEFARVLDEMGSRLPFAVLLENVIGFSTSHGGEDMRSAIAELNRLGYWCDIFTADARRFVPQSRPRMFIVGSRAPLRDPVGLAPGDLVRPAWVERFASQHLELQLQAHALQPPPATNATLANVVERLPASDGRWWDEVRVSSFRESLSPIQRRRADMMEHSRRIRWATAYRRTRNGKATWEIRSDEISGCLRTARGGSSKQALVEAGRGDFRVRWMTPIEYARLQGADGYRVDAATRNQALFGFGDAVCVPVVARIARDYLMPLVEGKLTADGDQGAAR